MIRLFDVVIPKLSCSSWKPGHCTSRCRRSANLFSRITHPGQAASTTNSPIRGTELYGSAALAALGRRWEDLVQQAWWPVDLLVIIRRPARYQRHPSRRHSPRGRLWHCRKKRRLLLWVQPHQWCSVALHGFASGDVCSACPPISSSPASPWLADASVTTDTRRLAHSVFIVPRRHVRAQRAAVWRDRVRRVDRLLRHSS